MCVRAHVCVRVHTSVSEGRTVKEMGWGWEDKVRTEYRGKWTGRKEETSLSPLRSSRGLGESRDIREEQGQAHKGVSCSSL